MASTTPQTEKKKSNGIESLLATMTVDDLTDLYRDYHDDKTEEGKRRFQLVRARLMRLPHDQLHPDEAMVDCTIPLSVTGHPYTINGKPYFGPQRLPKCIFNQLKHMEFQSQRVERERLQDRGRVRDITGMLSNQAAMIQSDM